MNIFMYFFRNKPLNFSKALEAALVQGVIGTSGHLSGNVYERIITFDPYISISSSSII